MGSLRATSLGQGPCEHHLVSGGPAERGVLQGEWTQYGPAWCWDGIAPLSPSHRLCPGGWSGRWSLRTMCASRPPSRHGCSG